MSGYAICTGTCFRCGRILTYNPIRVPSVQDRNGRRQPLCAGCVHIIQEEQRRQGLPVWPDPLPDAYEACREEELV